MITPMTQVEVAGSADRLDPVLAMLQRHRIAEVVLPPGIEPLGDVGAGRSRLDLVEAVLSHARVVDNRGPRAPFDETATLALAESMLGVLEELEAQEQSLQTESVALAHQVAVLAALEALVPELADLGDADLELLSLATVALVLDDPDGRVVALLREQLTSLLQRSFLLVSTEDALPPPVGVPAGVVGCLLVVPRPAMTQVHDVLGADRVATLSVAAEYAGRSLHGTIAAMRSRLTLLPAERAQLDVQRADLLRPHLPALHGLAANLRAQTEREGVARRTARTARTFLLRLWVPTPRLEELQGLLAGEPVVVTVLRRRRVLGEPPVLLRTRPGWAPYQRLVSFLSWPSPSGMDPSGLMAVALPFLFGVMVGDVVYGLVLVGLGSWLRSRPHPLLADAGRVLLVGGMWATVFGALFGEYLGNLGASYGIPALWFYRGGPAALEPLLLFALALGAAHIVLGLLLGVWSAIRQRQLGLVADRGGTLLVLVGLFGVIAALAGLAPSGLLTPAVVGVVVGVVVACVSHGALGLLLGPLELLGSLGNVLSYLRVAAVGLASVYLANVANELGAAAPLLLGILVATALHVLNLALAAFSPTVQALRLHYVEFFSKFYDGGGRPFTPLGHALDLEPARAPSSPPAPAHDTPDRAHLDMATT